MIRSGFLKKIDPIRDGFSIQKEPLTEERKKLIEEQFNETTRIVKGIGSGLIISMVIWITVLCAIWIVWI
jgi:hypothetical protein